MWIAPKTAVIVVVVFFSAILLFVMQSVLRGHLPHQTESASAPRTSGIEVSVTPTTSVEGIAPGDSVLDFCHHASRVRVQEMSALSPSEIVKPGAAFDSVNSKTGHGLSHPVTRGEISVFLAVLDSAKTTSQAVNPDYVIRFAQGSKHVDLLVDHLGSFRIVNPAGQAANYRCPQPGSMLSILARYFPAK